MDISRLTKMRVGVLTEAKGVDPEGLVDEFVNQQVEEGNMVEENQPEPEQPETQQDSQRNDQQQEDQSQNQQSEEPEDNPYSAENNADDGGNQGTENQDDDMPDIPDGYDPKQEDAPKLKILQSLSDKEYKLNNIKCHEQFRDLYNNVDNYINNNIIDIVTKNPKQQQIVELVHNNLSSMLDDLNTYIVYKFSEIYEDNIYAYTLFLKRFQIAMKIIKLISDENRKDN